MRHYSSFLVLLLFVFVVGLLFVNSSICYALSYDDIQHYVQETAILYHNNPHYQYIKTCIDNARTYFEPKNNTLANYRNVYIEREGVSDRYIDVYVYYTCDRVNSSGMYMSGKNIRYRYDGSNWWVQSQSNDFFVAPYRCYSSSTEQYNSLLGMNYTYNEVESIYTTPPTYVGNQGLYRINELEFDNYLVNNKINTGNQLIYYYKGDLFSNVSIPIGELVPNDCYHYEIYLTENSTNTDIAYVWGDYSTGQLIKSTNEKMYVNGANMLILKTLYLKYNEVYRVTITSYYGDYDNPTIKSIENLFIFLPNRTEISGDQIIAWASGDSINNDTIQIIENDNNNTNDLISSITDFNDITSGDIINNVDIVPIYQYSSGDSIANFFVDILTKISEVFLLDDEVTLQVKLPIFSDIIYVRSDFWITSDYLPELAEFINGAWWLLICIGMLYKIDVLVELYNFGDFINASYQIYQTRRLL